MLVQASPPPWSLAFQPPSMPLWQPTSPGSKTSPPEWPCSSPSGLASVHQRRHPPATLSSAPAAWGRLLNSGPGLRLHLRRLCFVCLQVLLTVTSSRKSPRPCPELVLSLGRGPRWPLVDSGQCVPLVTRLCCSMAVTRSLMLGAPGGSTTGGLAGGAGARVGDTSHLIPV